MIVVVLILSATFADAQTIRPRGAAPAAPAVAPAPKPAADPVAPTATPAATPVATTSIDAARAAYNKASEARSTARATLNAATKTAEGKAADSAEAKAVVDAQAEFDKAETALTATRETLTAANKTAFEQGKKLRPGERYMDGSTADDTTPSILTAAGAQVLLRECYYEEVPCNEFTVYGLLMQLHHDFATPADITRAYQNTAINIGHAEGRITNQIRVMRQDGLEFANEQISKYTSKYTSWTFLSLMALAFVLLTILSTIGVNMLTRRVRFFRGIAPIVVLALLGAAGAASAQTPPAPTTPACTIRSITTGAVVVKEQDPGAITIAFRNCKDVKGISTPDAAIVFTDFTATANRITAKVAASTAALTGPTSFKLTLGDGTETASPDAIYLLVLDTQGAVLRRDAAAATARVARTVASTRSDLREEVRLANANLSSELSTMAVARPTKAEAEMLIEGATAPLKRQITDLQMVNAALQAAVAEHTSKIGVHSDAIVGLAEGQVALGEKKGGRRLLGLVSGKPLNPEVAAAAERIRQAVSK